MNANALSTLPKRVHIVGICGVATSALAIAFHKAGVRVSGSDKGFFPPVSTELEKAGVPFYAGWHPERMADGGLPDVAIIGTASGSQNPETALAREKDIPIISEAEARGRYFSRKNSIVCAGTWGKTSTTAFLAYVLQACELDPSYVIGGVSLSTDAARLGGSDWSVIEGDEYKTSPTDDRPKFIHLGANHLILTSASWDHADLYPTEQAYFDAFQRLVESIPADGLIVANADDAGVARILCDAAVRARIVRYGAAAGADYVYKNLSQSKDGLRFDVVRQGEKFAVSTKVIGAFQAENMLAAFAMAHSIGIPPERISAALSDFKGIKRRFEKRLDGATASKGVTVFDCHAPTAEKAAAILKELRGIYEHRIIAVYEPNIGGRQRETAHKYDGALSGADIVIVPRLTKLKVADDGIPAPMDGAELAATISKTHPATSYIDDDAAVVDFLAAQAKKDDVVVFLGSHGFRGMIEETAKRLS